MAIEDHLIPSGFPWVCACATPVVTKGHMATGCDPWSLDPFGVPLGVRMHNRKLRNSRSDRRLRDPLWKCPWGVLYDVRVL
jgi:hypothetical protein